MPSLKDIGEFGLIEEIRKLVSSGKGTIVGIGDDAAVLESPREGMLTLLTTDMLVEGTHFDLTSAPPYRVGWKALGCGLSDIAAMGGVPRYVVVSLGAPGGLDVGFCRELYRGMEDLARRFGCGIVGGDTVRSGRGLIVSVTVTGEVERDMLTLRSSARPGEGVWVTGCLGGSLAGKHLDFMPRIAEARFLVERFRVRAMMDLSDGLGSDLRRMAEASRVGFRIYGDRVPVNREAMPEEDGETALSRALYDGEDFELLFTLASSADQAGLKREFNKRFKCGVACIGEVLPGGEGITLVTGGVERPLAERGFSHFG